MRLRVQAAEVLDARVAALAGRLPADFPATRGVVKTFAARAAATWRGWATGTPLPSGRRIHPRTQAYMRSVQNEDRSTPTLLEHEVFSDSPYHDALNDGTQERDMKAMLLTSLRARIGKKGQRYLIVPFRHATPETEALSQPRSALGYGVAAAAGMPGFAGKGEIPRRLMAWFRQEEKAGARRSRVVGQGVRIGATGVPVPAKQYQWGARYPGGPGEGERSKLTSAGPYTWKAGQYAGMAHFAGEGGKHGGYWTFRTMSERSPAASWVRPPFPGLRIVEQLRDLVVQSGFEDAARAAVVSDLERVATRAGGS